MKSAAIKTAVILSVVLLAGCQTIGGWFGRDDTEPPAELVEFDASISVEEVWSTRVGRGLDRKAPRLRPHHDDGRIWVADHRGRIEALDVETGRTVERFNLDMELSGGPFVEDDLLLIGAIDGTLVAMDWTSGEELWRSRLSSEIMSRPTLHDGIVIARSIDGRTFGFDSSDGERLWTHDRTVPTLTLRGQSDPLARGGVVFLGHDDGSVSALNVDSGEARWEERLTSAEGRTELDRLADVDGSLYVVGTDLFAATYHGRLVAMALESGRTLWSQEIASHSGVVVQRTRLATTDKDDNLWLVDRRNGSDLWRKDSMVRRQLTRPSFHGDYVIVGDKEGYLHWIDQESGEFAARERAGRNRFTGPPLIVRGMAITHAANGSVSAWRIDS